MYVIVWLACKFARALRADVIVGRVRGLFVPFYFILNAGPAKEFSYSPYSKFRAGAALLTTDGRVIKGGGGPPRVQTSKTLHSRRLPRTEDVINRGSRGCGITAGIRICVGLGIDVYRQRS